MQTKPTILFNILLDPRASAVALADAIAKLETDIAENEAALVNLEGRLSVELAKQNLGMMAPRSGIQAMMEQRVADSSFLANKRLTLAGLKMIDTAWRELPANTFTRERAAKLEFDRLSGQMVEAPAGRA